MLFRSSPDGGLLCFSIPFYPILRLIVSLMSRGRRSLSIPVRKAKTNSDLARTVQRNAGLLFSLPARHSFLEGSINDENVTLVQNLGLDGQAHQ